MSSAKPRMFLRTTKLLVGSALIGALLLGAGGVTTAVGRSGGLRTQAAGAPNTFDWNNTTTGSVPPPPKSSWN
jgi:hypothetical protein